jgi:hypothetical protein
LKTHNFHLQLCELSIPGQIKLKSWNNFTVILAQNTRIRKLGHNYCRPCNIVDSSGLLFFIFIELYRDLVSCS